MSLRLLLAMLSSQDMSTAACGSQCMSPERRYCLGEYSPQMDTELLVARGMIQPKDRGKRKKQSGQRIALNNRLLGQTAREGQAVARKRGEKDRIGRGRN